MSRSIDLNCDVGEGCGEASDAALLDCVTSASIACGFHAGDPDTMRRTVELALERGVAIGAHPSLADRAGFGRRWQETTPAQARELVLYQVGALGALAAAAGGKLAHVKPHGALYNRAARDAALAEAIAEAVFRYDPQLLLFGLAGSQLVQAGESLGLRTAHEVFADRTYQADGALTSRDQPDALISDAQLAADRIVRLLQTGLLRSQQGSDIALRADTICIHGDHPHAADFARSLRERLESAGVAVRHVFREDSARAGS